jgi:hypothetical protein
VLAPFPGSEVRERAAHYGLEILTNDWRKYDANQVVSRTRGASPAAIQEVADAREEAIEGYLRYQHWLYANGRLEGYEKQMYLRRRRQSLLWKLLLDEVIEGLPAFRRDPVAELESAVVEETGAARELVGQELERVLALGALVRRETRDGVRFAWSE